MNFFMRVVMVLVHPEICWKHRRLREMFYGRRECYQCRCEEAIRAAVLKQKWGVR